MTMGGITSSTTSDKKRQQQLPSDAAKAAAAARMAEDDDIAAEARELARVSVGDSTGSSSSDALTKKAAARAERIVRHYEHVPLNWQPGNGGHRSNAHTRRLLAEAGGPAAIQRFTDLFYQRSFADPHIERFIRDKSDPHGSRFASWITEKFGEGQPWSEERSTRAVCPFQSHGHTLQTPHDRSSAHFAAWHSPKRDPSEWGRHFKLDDCRVWMRLHFWAMRESGIFEASPSFADYYVRFIGHFVSVYERTATQFARDSARWSEDPRNVKRYLESGNQMDGVIGVGLREALRSLPAAERDESWPYEY